MVKNPPASAGDIRDADSIPGLGRSPGGGNGNPLQYSCLENSMDRGAWWAAVCRVAKSWTQLKWLSTHANWFKYFLGSDCFEKLIKAIEAFPASSKTHRSFSIRHWAFYRPVFSVLRAFT